MLGDPALKPRERDFLDGLDAEERPMLCDISLWEVALLVERKRLELDVPLAGFLDKAASPAAVQVVPVSPEVVVEMNRLPESFHRDPADRLIVATARVMQAPVATRDARIRSSRLVRLWKA